MRTLPWRNMFLLGNPQSSVIKQRSLKKSYWATPRRFFRFCWSISFGSQIPKSICPGPRRKTVSRDSMAESTAGIVWCWAGVRTKRCSLRSCRKMVAVDRVYSISTFVKKTSCRTDDPTNIYDVRRIVQKYLSFARGGRIGKHSCSQKANPLSIPLQTLS